MHQQTEGAFSWVASRTGASLLLCPGPSKLLCQMRLGEGVLGGIGVGEVCGATSVLRKGPLEVFQNMAGRLAWSSFCTSALWSLGLGSSSFQRGAVYCRVLSSIPGLYLLDASRAPSPTQL